VETQHTIGYGLRHITEECPYAILFLMLQSCFGIFVQGLVAGVVFAKISRPSKRKRTIIFSHNAVVSERDGKLCFMFKLANIRISQLSDARVKMLMIKSRRTEEGEFIPFQSYDMKVGHDWSGNDQIFFPWPKTVEHVIGKWTDLFY
jgi:potassium inwardly-rectifying channel subfamily J